MANTTHRALRVEAGFENRTYVTVYRTDLVALLRERDELLKALQDIDAVTSCTEVTGFESGEEADVAVKERVAALLKRFE